MIAGGKLDRAGIVVGIRGLLEKELRSRRRGARPVWLLTGYLAALTVATAGLLALATQNGSLVPPAIGATIFTALGASSVLLLAFITPALTTGAISGERERRTLDLLLVTRASPLGIVLGKLASSLLHILFLLAASLPAFGIVYLFAGVPLAYVGLVLLVSVATAVAHASFGLFASAVFKRSALASIVAYLFVVATVFGLPLLAGILTATLGGRPAPYYPGAAYPPGAIYPYAFAGPSVVVTPYGTGYYGAPYSSSYAFSSRYASSTGPWSSPPPAYVYASPLIAAGSALPYGWSAPMLPVAGAGPGGASERIGPTTTYLLAYDPTTGRTDTIELPSPWVYYIGFSILLCMVSLLGAALALTPIKPWSPWRFQDGRQRLGRAH